MHIKPSIIHVSNTNFHTDVCFDWMRDRSAFKMLTGKPTEKRPLGRPRHRWEDNVKMDLKNRYQYEELG